MCPYCQSTSRTFKKHGYFTRKSDGGVRRIRRFLCVPCRKTFSCRTSSPFRQERKSRVNGKLNRLLCGGVSQRECARILRINKNTVAKKVIRLGQQARMIHEKELAKASGLSEVVFDEMETFEHTKCKPLSIAVAVDQKTRRIYAARVAQMPAKGHLAAISRKKYGKRADHRSRSLAEMFNVIRNTKVTVSGLRSDECPRYSVFVKLFYPKLKHKRYKGRRGCVTGQGELKRGGFDPLFSLNHTCAMYRDHLKRLSRRTWCTTKDPDRLQDLLDLYTVEHNRRINRKIYEKPTLMATH